MFLLYRYLRDILFKLDLVLAWQKTLNDKATVAAAVDQAILKKLGLLQSLATQQSFQLDRMEKAALDFYQQALVLLNEIKDELRPGTRPVHLQIQWIGVSIGMPVQLTDGGKGSRVIASPAETDAAGNPVTVDPATISWSVSDPSAITIIQNQTTADVASPDMVDDQGNPMMIPPGGAEFSAVGAAGHLGAFQAVCTDTDDNLSAQDTITVVAGAATTLGINFGPVV